MSSRTREELRAKVTRAKFLQAPASMLCLALVLSPIAGVQAAELLVLAGGAMAAPIKDIAGQFESATGHKLVLRFGTTPELIKMATIGGPFDLGVVPKEVFKDAAAQAQFASGPQPTSLALSSASPFARVPPSPTSARPMR